MFGVIEDQESLIEIFDTVKSKLYTSLTTMKLRKLGFPASLSKDKKKLLVSLKI